MNINQSETGIGGPKVLVELSVTCRSFVTYHF